MKTKYDLIIGMGSMCACSQALREAGLQLVSFPFDWNGGPGIRGKTDLILDDFAGFMERGRMFRLPEPKFSDNQLWCDDQMFKYCHDFHISCDFETELPKVQAKYRRRIDRLYGLINRSCRALIVYLACPGWTDCQASDADYCRQRLSERWPDCQFDFLLFRYEKGRPFAERSDETVAGCRTVTFDYQDPKEEDWRADYRFLGRWLRTQYAVADYRTEAEREKWRKTRWTKDWARYHATNWLDYFWTKARYKVYKHLRAKLARKGVL